MFRLVEAGASDRDSRLARHVGHLGHHETGAAQFRDVLVVLLLIATAISAGLWLYERDSALPYEAMAIFAVVLLNARDAFKDHDHCAPFVAHIDRLKRSIQY